MRHHLAGKHWPALHEHSCHRLVAVSALGGLGDDCLAHDVGGRVRPLVVVRHAPLGAKALVKLEDGPQGQAPVRELLHLAIPTFVAGCPVRGGFAGRAGAPPCQQRARSQSPLAGSADAREKVDAACAQRGPHQTRDVQRGEQGEGRLMHDPHDVLSRQCGRNVRHPEGHLHRVQPGQGHGPRGQLPVDGVRARLGLRAREAVRKEESARDDQERHRVQQRGHHQHANNTSFQHVVNVLNLLHQHVVVALDFLQH
mmetsp:Transcript_26098/g.78658  ORF Transcript_26098/g.78658 Transcript_26098/m.78658 type:complete len:255 (-) Transcript_26098:788-1552(-)